MLKIQLIGHIGKDSIVNNVNGKNVINFSACHTEKFKDSNGEQREKSVWADCSYWTDKTGIAPYLKKGTQVYVEGTPEVRTFVKADGTTGATLSVRVYSIQLLGGGSGSAAETTAAPQGGFNANDESNDLPF